MPCPIHSALVFAATDLPACFNATALPTVAAMDEILSRAVV